MDWLKRFLPQRSQAPAAKAKPGLATHEIEFIARKAAGLVKAPELRLDKMPPDVIDEIARRAAGLVKPSEQRLDKMPADVLNEIARMAALQVKSPEIGLDNIPAGVLDQIAKRAAVHVKVPSPASQELPAHVIEAIASRAREMIKLPEGSEFGVNLETLSPRVMDAVARRAVAHLSAKALQEIAWEVVPELAELLIRKYLAEGRLIAPAGAAGANIPITGNEGESAQRTANAPAMASYTETPPSGMKQTHPAPVVITPLPAPFAAPPLSLQTAPSQSAVPSGPLPSNEFETAPVQTATADGALTLSSSEPARSVRRRQEADLPVAVESEDDKPFHYDARRYARLLVSELKLYNEQKVKDGRESRNLYRLLREEIVKSREAYSLRVKPPVAAQYDYFHDELVKGLALGDPANLGMDYPGPMNMAEALI